MLFYKENNADMNNNIKITSELIKQKQLIPKEVSPVRFAVASNVLFLTKEKQTDETCFLLYNYDPTNWKQVYPFFKSYSSNYCFISQDYASVIDEFQKILVSVNYNENQRVEYVCEDFKNSLCLSECKIQKLVQLPDQYWLKYSMSQKVWTIYLIEFYIAQTSAPVDIIKPKQKDVFLLPINDISLGMIAKTGKYEDLPIVDNTVEILLNHSLMKTLMEHSTIINSK